jgi:predicted RNA binding protein YcfA (HicA-like mRNA interferase family)
VAGIKSVSSKEVARRVEADGWFEVAQRGSHRQYKHPTKPGRVTIPVGQRDLHPKTVRSIERQAGIRIR